MQKNPKHIGKKLLECVAEIILTLLFLGLGAFVLSLFGANFETTGMDHEFVILLGILIFSFVLMVACFLAHCITKMFKRKDK